MRISTTLGTLAALALLGACHPDKAPQATTQDIDAVKQEAQHEVAEAQAEASKDLKSAAKVTGGDSAVVKEAKVTGSYDVAMVKADGDHRIAIEKCLTLQAGMQQVCKVQADADYEAAKTAAKATRLARQQ
jgi:hypothetical protein